MKKSLLVVPLLFVASSASAQSLTMVKSACDPDFRSPGSSSDEACTCMLMAARDIHATTTDGDYTKATYSSWHTNSTVSWSNSLTGASWSVSLGAPDTGEVLSGDIIDGSCFDLMANINGAPTAVRRHVAPKLRDIAGLYADADGSPPLYFSARTGSTDGVYTDRIDYEWGTWSESTGTDHPGNIVSPGLLLPLSPHETLLMDQHGNDLGVIMSQSGAAPLTVFLSDIDLDGELEADVLFDDGSSATADNLGQGTMHIHY